MKTINETSIYNNIGLKFWDRRLGWDKTFSAEIIPSVLESMARYLGEVKDKTKTKCIKIVDQDTDKFIFAGIVTFMPLEEDNTKGSYNLSYTFNEDDITDDMDVVKDNFPQYRHIFCNVSFNKFGINFDSIKADGEENAADYISYMHSILFDEIKQYLKANVEFDNELKFVFIDDDEEVEMFIASSALDGDKVYYSFTPSEVLKQFVKDDASIE